MTESFLALVRLGIGHQGDLIDVQIDWAAIEAHAKQQGLLGVLVDGIQCHKGFADLLPLTTKLRWIGEVMQGYEQMFMAYKKAVVDLAAWYRGHGYRMMVLKGLACGLNWPKPEHRPYGDIDIWLFGQQKEADEVMARELGIKIDRSHHHHTVFMWEGFTVENHYDFVNIHHQKSNMELERTFKSLGVVDSHSVELNGEKVYQPSPNLHSLFLIKHLASHFSTERITLRQVLDWAFFVEKQGAEIDWRWLKQLLVQFHMDEFFDCINLICVENLGFDRQSFYGLSGTKPEQKERIFNDILKPEFADPEPKRSWKQIPFKYRRWKANEWKHELCYNESMKSSFWSGVKNHLFKPQTI